MFVASAKAVIAGHEINPNFKIGMYVNLSIQHMQQLVIPEDQIMIDVNKMLQYISIMVMFMFEVTLYKYM